MKTYFLNPFVVLDLMQAPSPPLRIFLGLGSAKHCPDAIGMP